MFIAIKAAFILILVSAPERLIAGTGTTSIMGGSLKSVGELVIFFHSDWKLVMYILVRISFKLLFPLKSVKIPILEQLITMSQLSTTAPIPGMSAMDMT